MNQEVETKSSKIYFIGENGEELFSEDLNTNKDIVIKIENKKVLYPLEFNTFVDTVLAQKKLQSLLGNECKISCNLFEYRTIQDINFVTMKVQIEIANGKHSRSITLPFLCPIDLVTAQDLISRIQ